MGAYTRDLTANGK